MKQQKQRYQIPLETLTALRTKVYGNQPMPNNSVAVSSFINYWKKGKEQLLKSIHTGIGESKIEVIIRNVAQSNRIYNDIFSGGGVELAKFVIILFLIDKIVIEDVIKLNEEQEIKKLVESKTGRLQPSKPTIKPNKKDEQSPINISSIHTCEVHVNYGAMRDKLALMFMSARDRIIFALKDTEISSMLFDYVLSIISLKKVRPTVEIDIIYYQTNYIKKPEYEFDSLRKLKYMGCNIRLWDCRNINLSILFKGVLKDPLDSDNCEMILFTHPEMKESDYCYFNSEFHFPVIRATYSYYKQIGIFDCENDMKPFRPSIERINKNEYISDIYNKLKTDFRYQTIQISDLALQCFSYNQIASFITHQPQGIIKIEKTRQHAFFNATYDMYSPDSNEVCSIKLQNGFLHHINPPIIEKYKDEFHIIDGHTRLSTLDKNRSITCLLIRVDIKDYPSTDNVKTLEAFRQDPTNNYGPKDSSSFDLKYARNFERLSHAYINLNNLSSFQILADSNPETWRQPISIVL